MLILIKLLLLLDFCIYSWRYLLIEVLSQKLIKVTRILSIKNSAEIQIKEYSEFNTLLGSGGILNMWKHLISHVFKAGESKWDKFLK